MTRKELLTATIVSYLEQKICVFGLSASIDKKMTLIRDYLHKEDIKEYYSFKRVLQ